MRAGVAASVTLAKGLDVNTEQKQPRSTCVPWKPPQVVFWLPKANERCLPIWTGHTVGPVLPLLQWAGA